MAFLGLNFDANTVTPNSTFDPVPTNWYKVSIIASEMKQTKDGNGQYLLLEMEILEGEFAGRKLWDRLNLMNPNQMAVDIAYKTLSAICHAVGVMNVNDSDALHGQPMLARAVYVAAKGDYDAKNDIKGYKPIMAAVPGTAAPTAPRLPAASAPSRPPVATPRPPIATPLPDDEIVARMEGDQTVKRAPGRRPAAADKPWQKGPAPAPFSPPPADAGIEDQIPF